MNDRPNIEEERNASELSNPVQNVTFASNGDLAYGYLSSPASGRGPGVIVIQEWWGLTTHIAQLADRLAGERFVALAPDLYGGATTHDAAKATQLMQQLPVDRAAHDLGGAVDYLLSLDDVVGETVGAIGFAWAERLSCSSPSKRARRSPRRWPSTRSDTCLTTTRGSERRC